MRLATQAGTDETLPVKRLRLAEYLSEANVSEAGQPLAVGPGQHRAEVGLVGDAVRVGVGRRAGRNRRRHRREQGGDRRERERGATIPPQPMVRIHARR